MHTRDVLQPPRGRGGAARSSSRSSSRQRIATVGTGHVLVREARRLGLVKPGEQLFIVRGIAAWRKKH